MLRAIFMIGLFAMLGLFAVGMVFKLFGGIIGLTFFIVGLALKVLIVGGLLYFGIRILSPGTAARLRDRVSGTRLTRYSALGIASLRRWRHDHTSPKAGRWETWTVGSLSAVRLAPRSRAFPAVRCL